MEPVIMMAQTRRVQWRYLAMHHLHGRQACLLAYSVESKYICKKYHTIIKEKATVRLYGMPRKAKLTSSRESALPIDCSRLSGRPISVSFLAGLGRKRGEGEDPRVKHHGSHLLVAACS